MKNTLQTSPNTSHTLCILMSARVCLRRWACLYQYNIFASVLSVNVSKAIWIIVIGPETLNFASLCSGNVFHHVAEHCNYGGNVTAQEIPVWLEWSVYLSLHFSLPYFIEESWSNNLASCTLQKFFWTHSSALSQNIGKFCINILFQFLQRMWIFYINCVIECPRIIVWIQIWRP